MKKFLMLMVILALILVPTVGLASDEYNVELDIEEVKYILEVNADTKYKSTPEAGNHNHAEEVLEDSLLYVIDEHICNESELAYLEVNTEMGVRYICDIYADNIERGALPQLSTKNDDSVTFSSVGQYKITYYCSACNSPSGTGITASGTNAYIGSAANNDFPLGTVVHIEGYGNYTILDRMGSSGVIDIFTGYSDICHCSGVAYANAYVVG